jgi:uncharacterized protein (DUF2267 family)
MESDRHNARTLRTYQHFLRRVVDTSPLSEWQAEKAVISCLCALEQRLQAREARQLEAQLPVRLRELLEGCAKYETKPPRSLDKLELLEIVARGLGLEDWEAEPVVRSIFAVVRESISAGEVHDVASQLPKDLAALWRGDETPPATADQFRRHDNRKLEGESGVDATDRWQEPPSIPEINSPVTGIESSD